MSQFFPDIGPGGESVTGILLSIRDEGMENFREVRRAMEEVAATSLVLAAATERMNSSAHEAARGEDALADNLAQVKRQAVETAAAIDVVAVSQTGLSLLWKGITQPAGWWQVAAIAGVLMLAMAPLGAVLIASTVALISFTVGLAGFLAVASVAVGAFAAVGAAVLALGIHASGGMDPGKALDQAQKVLDSAAEAHENALKSAQIAQVKWDTGQTKHTPGNQMQLAQSWERAADAQVKLTAAQDNYNTALANSEGPMNNLRDHIEGLIDAWGRQAIPMTNTILLWVDKAIPAIHEMGNSLMNWFGARLPGVLAAVSRIVKDLTPDFQALGVHIGAVADHVGPQLEKLAPIFARVGFNAINGLLDNLVRLSDWFVKELPTLGPIVESIFGQIGKMVQWVADHWKEISDWIVKDWPNTVASAQRTLHDLWNWWEKNGESIKTFLGHVVELIGHIDDFISLYSAVYDFLNMHGATPTALLDALNTIINALKTVWGWIETITGAKPKSTSNKPSLTQPGWYVQDTPTSGPPDMTVPPEVTASRNAANRRGGVQVLDTGGEIYGPYPGAPVLIVGHAGEQVVRQDQQGDQTTTLHSNVYLDGRLVASSVQTVGYQRTRGIRVPQ